MITASAVKWGSYSIYSGPWTRGSAAYVLPPNPTLNDKILAVITATEGGRWDAVNMYDVCRCTVGIIQCCEGSQFWVSDMTGYLISQLGEKALAPLAPVLEETKTKMQRDGNGRWRFYMEAVGPVDRADEQYKLFFGGCSGKKGEWTEEGKEYATRFAVGLSNVYGQAEAIPVQQAWVVPRLKGFAGKTLRKYIDNAPKTAPAEAFICGALSFAANNPRRAESSFVEAITGSTLEDYSVGWLVHVLERMTFAPGVAIYPHRYNAIRSVIEKLFGVDLPDHSQELSGLLSPSEAQRILVHVLGYDLGSGGKNGDGVDGVWGNKSKTALMDFERRNGIPQVDGLLDLVTNKLLTQERDKPTSVMPIDSGPSLEYLLVKAVEQQIDDIGIIRAESLRKDHVG